MKFKIYLSDAEKYHRLSIIRFIDLFESVIAETSDHCNITVNKDHTSMLIDIPDDQFGYWSVLSRIECAIHNHTNGLEKAWRNGDDEMEFLRMSPMEKNKYVSDIHENAVQNS